ncbi:carbohydrate ABC transporter permease [Anaerocolumna sp. AGMB13025]|uniref:carbohydrate ABC transporter permease n=1 Tax=Anaerocolumna sp. AGMB13025 TaxID=3039116 RepID=UPI00241F31EA|nr:carbohydrate ABC transporter permease [Anaerocolumna sp. AGMB13025]WFR59046.1 carbohydrate ABC transporter permease [Anaerocolumna sp. AGMB13025]
MKINKHNSEHRFQRISLIIMLIITAFCIMPFVLMISASITDENVLIREGYKFWPSKVNLGAYFYLWAKRETIFGAYGISILVTVAGTVVNVILTSLFAYPLSRQDFKYRNFFAFFLFFTILFNGGMTASYIVWTQIFHIKNTMWALLVPNYLMGAFNVLLVRNYYTASIPVSILEAARVDGAKELTIYTRIILPLSKPVLITISLFSGMAYWNDWTNGLYYITNTKLYSINVYLNRLMNNITFLKSSSSITEGSNLVGLDLPSVGIRMAIAVIAILPVIIIFPMIQAQLIKGVVIGGVKG